ncbi:hypothetical protein [Parerythrobacter jejuensis]|uniref:Glycerophosphoryl diester phosphodiesterase membrane domain-containing protein n=1 Tax=Parerythrobacter jejuensis TaxID=795812 RepID=A0A845APY6_9SPHN|nr:hypothetical protein [Parerythrobacter jejuensis]MXP31457.1 hypothetical protein [Parerythrobacter jejuensis]
MKFDMSQAWNDALALLKGNLSMIAIVAGVFFFLPYALLAVVAPEAATGMAAGGQPAPDDFDAIMEQSLALYSENWWLFLLVGLLQGIGMISLLALLTDRSRPTVGDAIGFGVKALLPYIGTALLTGLVFVLAIGVPVGIAAATGSTALIAIVGLLAFVGGIYLYTKLSLTAPVIGIERIMNPVKVIGRSWQLTKGNSLRLFLFYFLLILVFGVVSIVIGMVFGLVMAIFGPQGAAIGTGISSGLINAVFVCIFLAVLAAIHGQLSGGSSEGISETFD